VDRREEGVGGDGKVIVELDVDFGLDLRCMSGSQYVPRLAELG
jgi:hypothetical protein